MIVKPSDGTIHHSFIIIIIKRNKEQKTSNKTIQNKEVGL